MGRPGACTHVDTGWEWEQVAMNWWSALHAGATVFLQQHGLLAACTALLIEETGVPLPMLPGDVIMLAVGIQIRHGLIPFWTALAALGLVTVFGATALY